MEKFVLYVDRVFPDGTTRTVLAASYEDEKAFEDGFRLRENIMSNNASAVETEHTVGNGNCMVKIAIQSALELQKPKIV